MRDNLDKILIVSNWAPPMVGAAQSLYNLFSQFPSSKYAILTHFNNIKSGASREGFWLPCDYYFFDHTTIYQKNPSKPLLDNTERKANQNLTITDKLKDLILLLLRLLRIPQLIFLGFIVLRAIIKFYLRGKIVIKEANIKKIMGTSDNGSAMISSYLLSKKTGLPLYYFLFDLYYGYYFKAPVNWLAKFFEKRLISHAKQVFVTNIATLQFYQSRYTQFKEKFHIIYNSVFVNSYKQIHTEYNPRPPYLIIYTGHIYWPQEQSLINLIKAMSLLKDVSVKLDLYIPRPSPKIIRAVQRSNQIRLLYAPQKEMPRIQGEATLLFLPLSWNTKSPDIITTATPGKFTDYLASGRPMLIHAPDYAYVSQYTKEYQSGLVVDKNDVQLLANTIRDFLKNPKQGQYYIDNALKIFYQNHDARKNAEKLAGLLNAI